MAVVEGTGLCFDKPGEGLGNRFMGGDGLGEVVSALVQVRSPAKKLAKFAGLVPPTDIDVFQVGVAPQ